MNFLLLRSNQTAVPEQKSVQENQAEVNRTSKPATTLEGLIAGDPFQQSTSTEIYEGDNDDYGSESGGTAGSIGKNKPIVIYSHVDVTEDEGWITIPYKEVPDNWREAPNIHSFRSLDRFFVFPGEQLHILACLSACKQDTEIITPFKVAAVMNKNGIGYSSKKQNGSIGSETNSVGQQVDGVADSGDVDHNDNTQNYVSSGESLLRMEDQKRQTERLLQRFNNSHFFVRVAELDEPLWSTKGTPASSGDASDKVEQNSGSNNSEIRKSAAKKSSFNAVVDRGKFDSSTCGGIARDAVKCCALPNGDIVVLLQINVGDDVLRDPVLEILQFERYQERSLASESHENLLSADNDPCGELLRWLLPLDNSLTPPVRSLSPTPMTSSTNIRSSSIKPSLSGSSGSQLFSFGHFRSYSMSSLPPNALPTPTPTPTPTPMPKPAPAPVPAPVSVPTPTVEAPSARTSFDPEDWDRFSFQKTFKSEKKGGEELLSFRGVPLEPERFSVRCGLEGIYVPGRRWRRKIEIIQPIEINSVAADCNTDDLLYVQIKNISPAHAPDVVVYIDAITVVSEDASKGGLPSSFPIACIEAGNEYSLPNLALRRGEEHSFILKPASSMRKNSGVQNGGNLQVSQSLSNSSYNEGKSNISADQYAVLVSCRCNYTESRLFFKQPTNWRPRISMDLMISVASEMSRQTHGSDGRVAQLPVQVLTLQASNLTSEDLTLTVRAPASFTSPPTVVSLSSSPSSPLSPFVGSTEFAERASSDRRSMNVLSPSSASTNQGHEGEAGSRSVLFSEQAIPISDVLPGGDLGCTHLWLQSKVPLGCVPSQSMATIKLELLPLTDGIITLDSLQIDVKEKGLTYVPEHSLKINATSSISTGII